MAFKIGQTVFWLHVGCGESTFLLCPSIREGVLDEILDDTYYVNMFGGEYGYLDPPNIYATREEAEAVRQQIISDHIPKLEAVLAEHQAARKELDIDAEIAEARKAIDSGGTLGFYTRARLEKLMYNLRDQLLVGRKDWQESLDRADKLDYQVTMLYGLVELGEINIGKMVHWNPSALKGA